MPLALQTSTQSDSADIASYLAECRALTLEEIRSFVPRDAKYGKNLYELMLDYPLREAKALRPALCVATCRALGGPLEGVLKSAAVLEFYHNAFLIHDDVEDDSEKRRDSPTLHRTHGVPIAVNVGDAMLALALEPLLDNTRLLGLGKALTILRTVARMARESAEGQALELDWIREGNWKLGDRDYLRMVHKKTTHYTFIAPMVLGGIVAGANTETLGRLRRFATALGAAFQIQDDILNLSADERAYGKDILGDLWEGKHTLILMHALRSATEPERRRATAILRKARPCAEGPRSFRRTLESLRKRGELSERAATALARQVSGERGPQKSAQEVAFLHELIQRRRSIEYARAVAQRRAIRAREVLETLSRHAPPSVHFDFLIKLTEFVVARDH